MSLSEEMNYIELDSGEGPVWISADSIETINNGDSETRSYNAMLFLFSGRMVLVQETPQQVFEKLKRVREDALEPVIGFGFQDRGEVQH